MEKENRSLNIEFRFDNEKRELAGVAIPFNTWSPVRTDYSSDFGGEFRERIAPEAVGDLIGRSDIYFLLNHNRKDGFLARNNHGKGGLKLTVEPDGLHFRCKLKEDSLSQYVYERVKADELSQMSFCFTVGEESWQKGADGVAERTIKSFDGLYDISVCDNSFYGIDNAISCRSYEEFVKEEEKKEEEARLAAAKAEEERLEAEKRAEEEKQAEEEKARIAEEYARIKEEYKDYLN